MCDATRSTQRDCCRLQQYKSCIIFASCDLLLQLQLRNWHIGLLLFFGRFVLAQLISCFSSTAMPVTVSVNFPTPGSLFAEDVFCPWTRMPHYSRCWGCARRSRVFEFHALLFNSRELTKQEKTGAMSFFHIIVENDQAELEPQKLETWQRTRSHCTYMASRPTHIRGLAL